MEYAVFKQQIMEQAKRILPQEEGYVITIVDQTEYGLGKMLIINKSDKEVVPGISMEEMYQDFSQNKKSIEEVIETIQDTVNTAFTMIPEIDGTHGIDFRDYDYIKDLLVVELERSEFNGEHLSHGIFEKQPIGALVLYLRPLINDFLRKMAKFRHQENQDVSAGTRIRFFIDKPAAMISFPRAVIKYL